MRHRWQLCECWRPSNRFSRTVAVLHPWGSGLVFFLRRLSHVSLWHHLPDSTPHCQGPARVLKAYRQEPAYAGRLKSETRQQKPTSSRRNPRHRKHPQPLWDQDGLWQLQVSRTSGLPQLQTALFHSFCAACFKNCHPAVGDVAGTSPTGLAVPAAALQSVRASTSAPIDD